ncbi:MAG: division/cell wall cluster transcriptional repressor MraZ [Rhodospirillaceae bacterium]|jgi:MraZ protein|nr:division/cell wall cluster transcriptional repressor MraZ [Rhodospirillaceae bacterium]MBT5660041.1 division/cell wall cluster transcriptional repressor MraZ [Rhodospirillaceae bacterium]MBT5751463.1 division/cell wall cluster transcriptional repressor MraZ [Rhodospirillaceae bacterium]
MALFLSTTVNKVDKKGRVSVPATFRASLMGLSFNGIVAFPSHDLGAIDACGIDRMEALSASLDDPDQYSPEELELAMLAFAEAEQLALDNDGRVVLPRPLADHAKIEDRVLFVGNGPTFQMWRPENYDGHRKTILGNAEGKGVSLRLRPIPAARRQPRGES